MEQNLYQRFPQRLTRWIKKEQLDSVIESFPQGTKSENIEYIIKSNGKKRSPKYAIFIKKENLLRRQNDVIIRSKLSLIDLVLMARPIKQEGVSIFQTLERCL